MDIGQMICSVTATQIKGNNQKMKKTDYGRNEQIDIIRTT